MSDWIDDPSCHPTALTHVGVGADQTNNTTNDPKTCVDPEECAGTGTKILYAVGGAALGFLGAWFLSDQQKKAAQERVASTARGTADGFRRGWSAPRAPNPVAEAPEQIADRIVSGDDIESYHRATSTADKESIVQAIVSRFGSEVQNIGDRNTAAMVVNEVMVRLRRTPLMWVGFSAFAPKVPAVREALQAVVRSNHAARTQQKASPKTATRPDYMSASMFLARQVVSDAQLKELDFAHSFEERQYVLMPSALSFARMSRQVNDDHLRTMVEAVKVRLAPYYMAWEAFVRQVNDVPGMEHSIRVLMRKKEHEIPVGPEGPHKNWLLQNGYVYHSDTYGWVNVKTGESLSYPDRIRTKTLALTRSGRATRHVGMVG